MIPPLCHVSIKEKKRKKYKAMILPLFLFINLHLWYYNYKKINKYNSPLYTAPEVNRKIVGNIQKVLKKVSKTEHLSGIHSALVAACAGTDLSSSELSDALEINKKTAKKAKQKTEVWWRSKDQIIDPPLCWQRRSYPQR